MGGIVEMEFNAFQPEEHKYKAKYEERGNIFIPTSKDVRFVSKSNNYLLLNWWSDKNTFCGRTH